MIQSLQHASLFRIEMSMKEQVTEEQVLVVLLCQQTMMIETYFDLENVLLMFIKSLCVVKILLF